MFFSSYEDKSLSFLLEKKLASLEYVAMIDMYGIEDLKYKKQYLHELYDKLFTVLFQILADKLERVSIINYDAEIKDLYPSYIEKIKKLKEEILNYHEKEFNDLEKFISKYKIDVENIITKTMRRIENVSSSVFDFEQTFNSVEESIFFGSKNIRNTYLDKLKDFDSKMQSKVEQMQSDHEKRCNEIIVKYKETLMNIINPEAIEVKPKKSLKSLKMEAVILKNERDRAHEMCYDIITSYNAYKGYPKRRLADIMSLFSISKDKIVSGLIEDINKLYFEIGELYIQKLIKIFSNQEEELDAYETLLLIREKHYKTLNNLYNEAKLLLIDDNELEIDNTNYDALKEELENEYFIAKNENKMKIEDIENEIKSDEIKRKQELENQYNDITASVTLNDDFTIDNLQKEYKELESELNKVESDQNSEIKEDYEKEIVDYSYQIVLTKDLTKEIEKLKETFDDQKDDLNILLLKSKIDQQSKYNSFKLKSVNNFANVQSSKNSEWMNKLTYYINNVQSISSNKVREYKKYFKKEVKKSKITHFANKLEMFSNDKDVSNAINKLNFVKSKCLLTDEQYIAFLETKLQEI